MNLSSRVVSRSHHALARIARFTAAGIASAVIATLQAAPVAGSFDQVAVDRFINSEMVRHRIPGIALAITHGNQIVHVRGYGEAQDGVPISGQTQFRIASLSKSATALAVLRCVDAGQIELDAPVSRYLRDFELAAPPAAARITVRQLLNHTSGLADAGFVEGLGGQQQTLADRVASLRAASPVDSPGAAFHYFDPNYQLLARLVETVSGEAFDTYLERHVFAPLAMRDSVSALTSTLPMPRADRLAQGHIIAYGMPLALPELSGFLGGSGGVVSTASDMARYLIAQSSRGIYAGRSVLSATGVSLMHTPPAGVASTYAMGWVTSEVRGIKTIEHNGVLSTFYADAVLLPDSGYGFALLYNAYALSAATLPFPEIKNGMIALLTGQVPAYSKVTLPWLGHGVAALSVLIASMELWSVLRLRQWRARAVNASGWRLSLSALWPLAPALLLLTLPRLLALQSGRYFDHVMLARAMPELIILLGVCGALGLLNSVLRVVNMCAIAQTRRTPVRFTHPH